MPTEIARLRREYHRQLLDRVLRVDDGRPNNADRASQASVRLGRGILDRIGLEPASGKIKGQTAGRLFEETTARFLEATFARLHHLRPGEWRFTLGGSIDQFAQYRHLADVTRLTKEHKELKIVFGDYIVTPDIVIVRRPVPDALINEHAILVDDTPLVEHAPLRERNSTRPIMHASVSCKWTIRSDRSQNARTEGLNLIRNRKGKAPHIVVVTGEPLPSRIASLAFGTGDIDCVYHFALPELRSAAADHQTERELFDTLVHGSRLRDISDLPLDLAV